MLLFLLVGCASDFSLKGVSDPDGAGEVVDTADASDDTAAAEEDGDDDGHTELPAAEDTGDEDDTGRSELPVDTGEVEDPPPEDDCAVTDDLIYVLSRDDSRLYTFDPVSQRFGDLGVIHCGTSQTPGSMAVSRDGVAYVRYADNSVFAVDLATLGCSATAYADRSTHFDSFGMGYATDSAETWRDQLYVANEGALGVLDTDTWSVTKLGSMPSQSELTGNAAGELWAMLPLEHPAQLVQLDRDSAATLKTLKLSRFPDPGNIDAFAFATWGGAFYLFVREYGMGSSTDVYEVDATGTMTKVLEHVGFDVVGAGVSTCAPT